ATRRSTTPIIRTRRSFLASGVTRAPRNADFGHSSSTSPMIPGMATSTNDMRYCPRLTSRLTGPRQQSEVPLLRGRVESRVRGRVAHEHAHRPLVGHSNIRTVQSAEDTPAETLQSNRLAHTDTRAGTRVRAAANYLDRDKPTRNTQA